MPYCFLSDRAFVTGDRASGIVSLGGVHVSLNVTRVWMSLHVAIAGCSRCGLVMRRLSAAESRLCCFVAESFDVYMDPAPT